MQIAERMSRLGTEQAFDVLARAKEMERQGIDMIHMEIGDTDFETPEPIKQACKSAIDSNKTHYLPSQGLLELREQIAKYVSETRKINVAAEDVVVTPGGKPIIFYTILATINPGDEVIVPDPGFPTYSSVVNFVGGKAVSLPLYGEKKFNFDPSDLEKKISPKTKLIIINSPHNPTGGILSHENLLHIAELAIKNDLWVLSDEVYDRLIFDGEFESIASLPGMKERTVILNALTKTFSMSGWRLGYGVMPASLARAVSNLINNSISCTPSLTQWAAIEAFKDGDITRVTGSFREELKKRAIFLAKEINKLPGVKCHVPKATIYLFPDIRATGKTSKQIFELLMNEAHVAALPGTAFGNTGEGYLRLSFGAVSLERSKEAVERMKKVWTKSG